MTNREHSDLVMRSEVCMVGHSTNVSLARAGAVSEYVGGKVIFCGGKNGAGVHDDCLVYNPASDAWRPHSRMTRPRDEAASAVAAAGNAMIVIGGIGERSVESFNVGSGGGGGSSNKGKRWQQGPPMPEVRARACAAALDDDTIIVMGKR